MAKRVIVPENEILRYYRTKNLLTPPEVFELSDLDMEMGNVLNRTDLTVREKASRYNQALSKFKSIYSDVFNDRRIDRRALKLPQTSDSVTDSSAVDGPTNDGGVGEDTVNELNGADRPDVEIEEESPQLPAGNDDNDGDVDPSGSLSQYSWEKKLSPGGSFVHGLLRDSEQDTFRFFENNMNVGLRGAFNVNSAAPVSDFVTVMNYLFSEKFKSVGSVKFSTGKKRPKLIRDIVLTVVKAGLLSEEDAKKFPNFVHHASLPTIRGLVESTSPFKRIRTGIKKTKYSFLARKMLTPKSKVHKIENFPPGSARRLSSLAPDDDDYDFKRVVRRKNRKKVPIIGSGIPTKVNFDGWNNECNFSF